MHKPFDLEITDPFMGLEITDPFTDIDGDFGVIARIYDEDEYLFGYFIPVSLSMDYQNIYEAVASHLKNEGWVVNDDSGDLTVREIGYDESGE